VLDGPPPRTAALGPRALATSRSVTRQIESIVPYRGVRLFDLYDVRAAEFARERPGQTIIDIGAGAQTTYAARLADADPRRLIGVDVDAEALARNPALSDRVVADVAREGLPIGGGEVDLITSRAVLEHIEDVPSVIAETQRVLRPGGRAAHIFSTKRAPFALVNRLLPDDSARALLYALKPEARDAQGFKAFYDHCTPRATALLHRGQGFVVEELLCSYRTSQYFDFFPPAFLAARAYESVLAQLNLRLLASYVFIVVRKW